MNIRGKICTLRAIEKSDLSMLRAIINDPDTERLVVGWSFPVSSYGQEKWFESLAGDANNQRYIIETENDGAVGMATLTEIDWKNGAAFHGIKLANRPNRTKGLGTDAVMAIMRYAFDELHLHRLIGAWFDYNAPSKGLYTKCGWQVEGISRESIYKNGRYHDLAMAAILAGDYYKLIEENHYWD